MCVLANGWNACVPVCVQSDEGGTYTSSSWTKARAFSVERPVTIDVGKLYKRTACCVQLGSGVGRMESVFEGCRKPCHAEP